MPMLCFAEDCKKPELWLAKLQKTVTYGTIGVTSTLR